MKRQCSYLVALILIVDSHFATGESPRKTGGNPHVSNQRDEKMEEEKLRAFLETTDLAGVNYLFGKSKKVTISRGKSGQLRIFVGDVSGELLRTRIKQVTFEPFERYNAIDAIIAITRTKEVQATLGRLGLEQPLTAYPGGRQEPDRRFSHLPVSIKDVTMEGALDEVAVTFGCIIIYAEWTVDGASLFNVSYVRGARFKGLGRNGVK